MYRTLNLRMRARPLALSCFDIIKHYQHQQLMSADPNTPLNMAKLIATFFLPQWLKTVNYSRCCSLLSSRSLLIQGSLARSSQQLFIFVRQPTWWLGDVQFLGLMVSLDIHVSITYMRTLHIHMNKKYLPFDFVISCLQRWIPVDVIKLINSERLFDVEVKTNMDS